MSVKRKIGFIVLLFCAVLMAFVSATSVSKYIFEHHDKIEGHYADIHLSHNGGGQTVIMEESAGGYVGYFNLTIRNYVTAEDQSLVSARRLSYAIRTPESGEIGAGHLTDAWGENFPLYAADSGKYAVSFSGVDDQLQSLGKDAPDGDPEQEFKTYIVEVRRSADEFLKDSEEFDVIIEIREPYVAYRVFTVKASTGLISVGADTDTHFGFNLVTVRVTTAKNYAFSPEGGETITFADPAKVVFTWDHNVSFDINRFAESTAGSLPKDPAADYAVGYRLSDGGQKTELTMFLPQGSNLTMYFYVPAGYEIAAHAWFGSGGTEYAYENIAGVNENGVVQGITSARI